MSANSSTTHLAPVEEETVCAFDLSKQCEASFIVLRLRSSSLDCSLREYWMVAIMRSTSPMMSPPEHSSTGNSNVLGSPRRPKPGAANQSMRMKEDSQLAQPDMILGTSKGRRGTMRGVTLYCHALRQVQLPLSGAIRMTVR